MSRRRYLLSFVLAAGVAAVVLAVLAARPEAGPPSAPPPPVDSRAAPAAAAELSALGDSRLPGLGAQTVAGENAARIAASLSDAAELAKGKVLAHDLGRGRHSLYAFPTASGAVCLSLTLVSAGCVPSFPPRLPLDWTVGKPDTLSLGQGEPVAIWGIAPDEVTQVQVRVAGELHDAGLDHNAYFYEADANATPPSAFTDLVVGFRNGETKTLSVP